MTGASGFVARHFISALCAQGSECEIIGADRGISKWLFVPPNDTKIDYETVDLLDKKRIAQLIENTQPNFIVHLASLSSVASSWHDPVGSYQNNTNIFLNIVEAVRMTGLQTRILSIGSSEEYGPTKTPALPIVEDTPLNPCSPYAVARVSQEMLGKLYAANFGLDIVLTRSFNHLGIGQRDNFFIPSIVRQVVGARHAGAVKCSLKTGNVDLIRDFIDVRDVVAAYLLLLSKGKSGEVYNVCSGRGVRLIELIEKIADCAKIGVEISRDEKLMRPTDIPAIIGSNEKLKKATGWSSKYSIEQSIRDIVDAMGKSEANALSP